MNENPSTSVKRNLSTIYELPAGLLGDERIVISAEVKWPSRLAQSPCLLICLPGGGLNRRYFDMFDGQDRRFSFADAMTEHGHVVAMIDPPGVGSSTRPADGFQLTVDATSKLINVAAAELISKLSSQCERPLRPISVGHSAGAMTAAVRQFFSHDCDGLVMLCFGTLGLPEHLGADHLANLDTSDRGRSRMAEFARSRFNGQAYVPPTMLPDDSPAARALRSAADVIVTPIGIQAMSPGNAAPEIAAIDVPVFYAAGDQDMVGPLDRIHTEYPACPDFTMMTAVGAGHHPFVTDGAPELFSRIATWLETTAFDR